MKTYVSIVLLLALLPAGYTASARKYPRINFDISLLRYGPEQGMDNNLTLTSKGLLFSAAKIGMALNAHSIIHAGLRRQPEDYTMQADEFNRPVFVLSGKGFEATLGYEYRINLVHSFALLAEAGLFYDRTDFGGADFRNASNGQGLTIHCRRLYTGIYPELKISYSLSRHVSVIAGTRLRAGMVRSRQGYFESNAQPYIPKEGMSVQFEPLSNISFSYQL
ncbi:hypothetical protein [Taibaiella helva]|uniref:hypothetical protein n=1 Tax=Taibaiella helva TaxID=2301235 RepID=UPI000E583D4A|nr:hypothetical protein [Taibaiella helva]